jgi:hypothetical protein
VFGDFRPLKENISERERACVSQSKGEEPPKG